MRNIFERLRNDRTFWTSPKELKMHILNKYPDSLEIEELSDSTSLLDLIEKIEKPKLLKKIASYSNFHIGLTKSDTKILLKTKSIADYIISEGSVSEMFDASTATEEELWKHQGSLYEMRDPMIVQQFLFLFFHLSKDKERITFCIKYLLEKPVI